MPGFFCGCQAELDIGLSFKISVLKERLLCFVGYGLQKRIIGWYKVTGLEAGVPKHNFI